MFAGAVVLALYLAYTNPLFDRSLTLLRASLLLSFATFAALGSWLRPASGDSETYPAARSWSGVGFVVATGLAASAFFAWAADVAGGYLLAATTLIATLVVAAMLWPVAPQPAGESG